MLVRLFAGGAPRGVQESVCIRPLSCEARTRGTSPAPRALAGVFIGRHLVRALQNHVVVHVADQLLVSGRCREADGGPGEGERGAGAQRLLPG